MEKKILVCGVNWLGDSVMSMPALRAFREANPNCRITILVKPRLAELWKMCPSADEIKILQTGLAGTFRTAGELRQEGFSKAFIFPNSFRSALIPYLAGIPARRGMARHQRRWLLTEIVPCAKDDGRHQAMEYFDILNITAPTENLRVEKLTVPPEAISKVEKYTSSGNKTCLAGIIPGAAFGPSKIWPAEYFTEAGRAISGQCRILVLGSEKEKQLCNRIAGGIGDGAVSLAGKTSIPELIAILSACRVVVCNDSGGMHLASSAGSRVVAVFGITDPVKTGPLGPGHTVITDENADHSRDITRNSGKAEKSLRSISPDKVISATLEILRS